MREEQAEQTRERLIDAALALHRRGVHAMSYAALAREAKVSAPTVYRHFPDRKDLFDAIFQRIEGHAPSEPGVELTAEALRSFFARFDDLDAVARAARLTTSWEFSRATTVPRRRALLARLIDERAPGLREPERTWAIDLGVVLVSSAMAEAFALYLDRTGSETADRVLFALDALFAHVQTLQECPP